MQRENVVASAVGLLAAAAVFAVLFWLVDAGEVLAAASRADPALLAAVAATILLWNAAWGVALWNVLRALDVDVPLTGALLVNAAGAFANHVTPFGQAGGEPVTAWLLTKSSDTDYEVSLASIASLDAINVVPSLAFAAVGSLYYVATAAAAPGRGELGLLPVGVLAAAVGLPLVGAAAWRHRTTVRERAAPTLLGVVDRLAVAVPRVDVPDGEDVAGRVAGFADALGRVAVSRERLAAAVGCSAVGWGFQAVGLWVTFLALESFVPLFVPFFVLPLGKVGSVFPTPGGLGGTEAINVTLLVALTAVDPATIAAAVTIHSVGGYLLTTTVGAAATGALGVRK